MGFQHLHHKHFEKKGTSQLKDTVDNNCKFLDHLALNKNTN